jgi:maleamate amidohydrolase
MERDFEDHCWKDVIPADVLKIYAAYRREIYVGRSPALLAIDLYNMAYRGGPKEVIDLIGQYPSACGVHAWGAIEPTQRQSGPGGQDDFEIYEAFAPQPGDLVIEKERASAFYGTPLVAQLTGRGIDSLIICGESTSGCVRASTVDAYSNGYHATVAEECVFDRAELIHKISLFDLHHKYADVMETDAVIAELESRDRRNSAA